MSTDDTIPEAGVFPPDMLRRLIRRGWTITEWGQHPSGYHYARASYLRGDPNADGPDYDLVSRGLPDADACVADLLRKVKAEIAKGKWVEIV
jgi:hypothetical protein